MLTCKEMTRRIATGDLEGATLWDRLSTRMHLAMCTHCRRFAAQIKAIGASAKHAFHASAIGQREVERLRNRVLRNK